MGVWRSRWQQLVDLVTGAKLGSEVEEPGSSVWHAIRLLDGFGRRDLPATGGNTIGLGEF